MEDHVTPGVAFYRLGEREISTFGEILRKIRTDRHLKQADLALPGMSRSLVAQFEADRRLPSYEMLQALAKTLDVSVAVFFDGQSDESIQQALVTLMHQAEQAQARKEWEEALRGWESAYILCKSYQMDSYAPQIRWHQGETLAHLRQWQLAVDTLLPLLIPGDVPDNPNFLHDLLRLLAQCFRSLDQVETSNTFLSLCTQAVRPTDVRWIRCQINLGSEYLLLGDWATAARHFQQAIDMAHFNGDGLQEGWALIGWCTAQLNQGKTDAVQIRLTRAEHLATLLQSEALLQSIRHERIVFHRLNQAWDEAKALLAQCQENGTVEEETQLELLHEQLVLATLTKDRALGNEAVRAYKEAPRKGRQQTRLWLAIAEYHAAFREYELAMEALQPSRTHLALGANSEETTRLLTVFDHIQKERNDSE